MIRLVLPAFAKINLGLHVTGRRTDGYHELRTVYQTISLHDTLTFETPTASLFFSSDDETLPSGEENLVMRAARAFGRSIGRKPRVRILLRKRIPAGAGLGGGSSDAAVTLLALNRIHGGPLTPGDLGEIAEKLGSDVPFFLTGGTALGLGRGEIVRPLRDLEPTSVVLLVPDFAIPTVEAFGRVDAALTPRRGQFSIYRFVRQRVSGARGFRPVPNELERAVAPFHPRLGRFLRQLRLAGATVAAMTGSGSAVYGLFDGRRKAAHALREDHLTESSPIVRAWLGRTVGAAEYSAKLLPRHAESPRRSGH